MEKFYMLHLDDTAAPGFCSFDKIYIGTEKTIKAVADNLEKNKHYLETVSAIRSYFNGNHSAAHNVAYRNLKVLIPVKIEAERKSAFNNKEWTHTNIWGFPYEMKCDSAIIHQIVFKYNGEIYRCIRAWLKNLCYKDYSGNRKMLDGGFWGNSSILNVSNVSGQADFTFNNLLYVEEERYESDISSAINDMQLDEKIELGRICDEIFADG